MIPTPLVRAGCPASLWGPPWRPASLWGCLLAPSLTVGTPAGAQPHCGDLPLALSLTVGMPAGVQPHCGDPHWPERGVGEEEHRLRGAWRVVWASPCSADWLYTWAMMPHPLWSVSLAVELAAEVSRYLPALCLWEPSDSHIL